MTTIAAGLRSPVAHEAKFEAGITGLAFARDGLLAAAIGDGTVQLIDAGGAVRSVPAHTGAVLSLLLDIDGQGFLTGGDDGRVVRVDADGVCTTLVEAPGRQIDALAVTRAGSLRSAAIGREVRLIDAAGATVARTTDHPSTVSGITFNSKGKRLAVSHYGGVTLWWSATLGETPKRLAWRGSHIGVSWSPDGKYVMTATQERELHGWRVSDDHNIAMRGYNAKVRSVDWLARPPLFVTSGAECVVAWPFSGAGPEGKPPIEVGVGNGALVARVAVHPTRPLVAAGFTDGAVMLSELVAQTGRTLVLSDPGEHAISALAWSADGTRLAVGTDRGALTVLDVARPVS